LPGEELGPSGFSTFLLYLIFFQFCGFDVCAECRVQFEPQPMTDDEFQEQMRFQESEFERKQNEAAWGALEQALSEPGGASTDQRLRQLGFRSI
jgi:hypothetical protein